MGVGMHGWGNKRKKRRQQVTILEAHPGPEDDPRVLCVMGAGDTVGARPRLPPLPPSPCCGLTVGVGPPSPGVRGGSWWSQQHTAEGSGRQLSPPCPEMSNDRKRNPGSRTASLGRQVCPSCPCTLFRLSLSWVFFLLLGKREHSKVTGHDTAGTPPCPCDLRVALKVSGPQGSSPRGHSPARAHSCSGQTQLCWWRRRHCWLRSLNCRGDAL